MKRLSILLFSFFNFLIAANAQQAGDIISGTVNDEMGPVMMANVVEKREKIRREKSIIIKQKE